ncbi:Pnap_2097 family protein [Donghicola sp. XS_ASV15]|uniref:Pnap_2097 family protein n=1 Tax=Donghicola sp. XS_ASV15 TaxID=3241295 RepID=UPI003517FE32
MNVVRLDRASTAPTRSEQITLGMAQLSPFGVSEQWLLRDCGDRHWGLIAESVGGSMAFRDETGHPVYAAFCATSVAYDAAPTLGGQARILSSLFQVAPQRIGSEHLLVGSEGTLARVQMITCFLRHDESGSNRQLLRTSLNGLQDLPPAPESLMEFSETARQTAREARSSTRGDRVFDYTPNPALDFNAVGLLYFPTFSKIAELASPTQGFRQRDVIYMGNVDLDDRICAFKSESGLLLYTGDRLIGAVSCRA